ncbi:C-C motif chemokine 20b [Scleropages formosus]|uniref:C-C motif chemokine 20b n=1 Tax=Scleropages formosus TaxID=113540 RepID=UPI0008781CCC|nr:C-C motif chemokine 20-like [Scleropages formosus]
MTCSSACTLALLATLCLHLFVSPSQSASCCLRYSMKKYPCHKMKTYSIQSMMSSCDINAVIFHTMKGRYICADPAQKWTLDSIQCLNARTKKAQ